MKTNYNKDIYELLMRSFDEQLAPAEQEKLDRALTDSVELRQEKTRLEACIQLSKQATSNMETPPYFASKVMNRIEAMNQKGMDVFQQTLNYLFPKIALPALALIALFFLNLYFTEGNITTEIVLGLSDISDTDASYFTIEEDEYYDLEL